MGKSAIFGAIRRAGRWCTECAPDGGNALETWVIFRYNQGYEEEQETHATHGKVAIR